MESGRSGLSVLKRFGGLAGGGESVAPCVLIVMCDAWQDVGVALAHGQEADDWKGPLMNSLADSLAKEGV